MKDIQLNKIGFITLGLAKFCGLCGLLCMFIRSRIIGASMLGLAFVLIGITVVVSLKALKQQKGEWKK